MKFTKIILHIAKSALTAAFAFFTAFTASAQDPEEISMSDNQSLTHNIPDGTQSVKVIYGDGSNEAPKNATATLKLTAPEGYVLQLSGTVDITTQTGMGGAILNVYDGENTSANKLVSYSANAWTTIKNQSIEGLSTGNTVFIYCATYSDPTKWKLAITVTLIEIEQHSVTVSSISHGSIVADKQTAVPNTTVNLTVTPDEGYVLKSINVTDADGNIQLTPSSPDASFGDVNYFAASNFSFKMRTADATVSATFMSKSDFTISIPQKTQRDFTIPEGTTSFKVYNQGYHNNSNGYLLLTAPQGFKMKVSGRAYIFRWSSMIDYLEIFDGATSESTSLGKFWESTKSTDPNYTKKEGVGVPVNVTSSENKLLFYLYSDGSGYYDNKCLNLTVTLIDARKSVEGLTIAIPAQTYTGSAIEPEITVTDGETTLTLGTDYTVSYSDNTNVGTAKATITGIGIYKGEIEKTFTITPKITIFGALTLTQDQNGITATIEGNYDQADALTITEDIAVKSVTYNRTFKADGGAYTTMLPFGFTVTSDIKGTFHTLSTLEPTETETVWKATMSEAITTIEANKPYIFVPSEDFDEMTFSNVTLKKTTDAPLINVCANTNWKLHGVYSQKVWTDEDVNNYGFAAAAKDEIAAGEFVHFVTGATLKATRCYLEYSKDGFSKSAVVLPEKIIVVFPETSSVIEPNDPKNSGDVITPVSEIASNSGTKVWSYDGSIFIEAQPNTDYSVIDITGRTLKTGVTSSTRETVTLSRRAAGIIIVKINGKTFKINY